jgi:hypothetical protein
LITTITKEKVPIEKYKTTIIIDEQLQNVNIPKCLIESLNNSGFPIEMMQNSHQSAIAEVLKTDNYVTQKIYQEIKYRYMINYNQEYSPDYITR